MREQKRADIQRNFIESTDIKFGRIHKTSDEYRAIADVASDTYKREVEILRRINQVDPYRQINLDPIDNSLNDVIRKRLESKSNDYLKTYEVVDRWVSKSFLEGEVVASIRQRLEYLDGLVKKAGQYSAISFIDLFRK